MLFNNDTKSMSLVTLWSSYILHTLLNCELYTSCHCTVCKSLIILNSEFVQLYSILYLIQISVGSGLIFIFNWEWWTLKQGLELGVGGAVVEVCMCGSRSECPISISQINYFPMCCVCGCWSPLVFVIVAIEWGDQGDCLVTDCSSITPWCH